MMNKLVATTLESKFHVFDVRTHHASKGYSSLVESVCLFTFKAFILFYGCSLRRLHYFPTRYESEDLLKGTYAYYLLCKVWVYVLSTKGPLNR